MITRRSTLKGSTLLIAAPILGVSLPSVRGALAQSPAPGASSGPIGLIDAHCHIINATDIPIHGYLRKIYFELYDQEVKIGDDADPPVTNEAKCGDLWDDLQDALFWPPREVAATAVNDAYNIALRGRPRTAKDELNKPAPLGDEAPPTTEITKEDVDLFFLDPTSDKPLGDDRGTPAPPEPPEIANWSEDRRNDFGKRVAEGRKPFQQWLFEQARLAGYVENGPLGDAPGGSRPTNSTAFAEALSRSDNPYFRLVRWIKLLVADRSVIAARLEALHADKAPKFIGQKNGRFVLYAPAILDYSKWLEGEPAKGSDLKSQAELMRHISNRGGEVRFHGYMGYCPLRDVHEDGTSIELLKDSVQKYGFLGAKVYPTMGFKPLGNANSKGLGFPRHAMKMKKGSTTTQLVTAVELARQLDRRLREFYQWCVAEEVPILAHATNSYGAGPCYARRADPANWKPVIDAFPNIRVCLAHFGDFEEAFDEKQQFNEMKLHNTWEWHFGELTKSGAHVYADVSYFSEVLQKPESPLVPALRKALVNLITEYREVPSRLIYGTDYLLLALERNPEEHYQRVHKFLSDVFNTVNKNNPAKTEEWLADVFRNAAVRFMGLKAGDKARGRLETFYKENGVDKDNNNAFLEQFN